MTHHRANRKNARTTGRLIMIAAIVALIIGIGLFSQATVSKAGQALGHGKLEPALEVLNGAKVDPNATAGVIVQFLEDEAIANPVLSRQELKKQPKRLASGLSWMLAENRGWNSKTSRCILPS